MRITLDLDEALIARAGKLTGIQETETLVRAGIEALIQRASAERLAALGGTQRSLGRLAGGGAGSGRDHRSSPARGAPHPPDRLLPSPVERVARLGLHLRREAPVDPSRALELGLGLPEAHTQPGQERR